MKIFKLIAKIVLALAAVAGIVYVIATYGERIVAWARNLLNSCKCRCGCDCDCDCDECDCDCDCDECDCDCDCDCECDEEAPAEEAAVVAEQTDFEG